LIEEESKQVLCSVYQDFFVFQIKMFSGKEKRNWVFFFYALLTIICLNEYFISTVDPRGPYSYFSFYITLGLLVFTVILSLKESSILSANELPYIICSLLFIYLIAQARKLYGIKKNIEEK